MYLLISESDGMKQGVHITTATSQAAVGDHIISTSILYLRPQYSTAGEDPKHPERRQPSKNDPNLIGQPGSDCSNIPIYGKNMEACFRHRKK